jgi:type II secretory pathway component PulC
MTLRSATLLATLVLIGCGGAQPATTAPVEESSLAAINEAPTRAPAPACPGDTISRADLTAVLDAGPAPLLAMVETRPRHRGGRFIGFEIVDFTGGEPPSCPALRTGDVLVSVNGRPIERPEHYFEVFQLLRSAAELKIEIVRGGKPTTLSYTIKD